MNCEHRFEGRERKGEHLTLCLDRVDCVYSFAWWPAIIQEVSYQACLETVIGIDIESQPLPTTRCLNLLIKTSNISLLCVVSVLHLIKKVLQILQEIPLGHRHRDHLASVFPALKAQPVNLPLIMFR